MFRRVAIILLLSMSLLSGTAHPDQDPILIFAAASLGGPLDSMAAQYMAITGTPVLIAYGASGTLAQQIQIGADVDLFISADTSWVVRLVADKNSPVLSWQPFLRNHLVTITSASLDHRMRAFGALDGPTINKIAIADPETAPVGRYATDYLKRIGIFDRIRGKLIIQDDARGVVNAVRLEIADIGFVYSSDATVSNAVRTVETIPDSLFPPIVYGLALMKTGRADQTRKFARFMQEPASLALFARYGFMVDSLESIR